MKQKKALIFTTEYLNLQKPVIEELERLGWEVTTIKDCLLEGDPKLRSTPLRNFIKRFIKFPKHLSWLKRAELFWSPVLATLCEHYDLFLCLNAFTIPPSVVETIKQHTDRTVLYVWDSSRTWDFSIIAPYFDEAYTFDLLDSERHSSLKLLPNYYTEPKHIEISSVKYPAIIIGANRDQRIRFVTSLASEIRRHRIYNYFFKLLPHSLPPLSQRLFKDYRLSKKLNSGKLEEFELKAPLEPEEYMSLMEQSEIIVDDVMPEQSGLTPRFIWGLARGKKIITTNRYALRYNFVAPENVCIVDRKNPIIPDTFLAATPVKNPDHLHTLEIKNWVRIITGESPLPDYRQLTDRIGI